MNRRSFLALSGWSLAAGLAGCLVDGSPSDPVREPRQFQYDARNTGVTGANAPRDGAVRWKVERSELGQEKQQIDGLAFGNDRLLVTTNGELHVLDPADGSELWHTEPGHGGGKPVLSDGTAFVTWNQHPDFGIRALDLTDGSERWQSSPFLGVTSAPTLVEETIYVGVLREAERNTGTLLALDTADGSVRWRFDDPAQMVPTPAVADGTVYVGGGNERSVYALDAETGEKLWETPTAEWMGVAPTVVDDTVYIPTDFADWLYALDTENGTERWRVEAPVSASVAATTEAVYVPTRHGVVALDTDGERKWNEHIEHFFGTHPPVVAGETLIITGETVLCLDVSDGTHHWEQTVEEGKYTDTVAAGMSCEPIVADDTVFVGTAAGDVYAVGE